ncbi:hypothetical protein Trisim1_005522 [Trichoderma cf. simile WF8]
MVDSEQFSLARGSDRGRRRPRSVSGERRRGCGVYKQAKVEDIRRRRRRRQLNRAVLEVRVDVVGSRLLSDLAKGLGAKLRQLVSVWPQPTGAGVLQNGRARERWTKLGSTVCGTSVAEARVLTKHEPMVEQGWMLYLSKLQNMKGVDSWNGYGISGWGLVDLC